MGKVLWLSLIVDLTIWLNVDSWNVDYLNFDQTVQQILYQSINLNEFVVIISVHTDLTSQKFILK